MTPNNTINNKDNNNNIYSAYSFFTSADFRECYDDFVKMRKKIKKPMTERAEKIILNKLGKMCADDVPLAIEILENSILKSWQDVFPLNPNQNNYKTTNQPKSSTPTEKRKFTY